MKKGIFFACLVLGSVLIVSIVTPIVYIRVKSATEMEERRQLLAEHHRQSVALTAGMHVVPQDAGPAPADPLEGLLTDPAADHTENNYLARTITQDVVDQAYFGTHPGAAFPKVSYMVSAQSGQSDYHTQIFAAVPGGNYIQLDLHPAFAWDATTYAQIAKAALGDAKAASPDPHADNALANLLEPTGEKLAKEDVRLSARLQQFPLDAAAHEEAALVLLSLALREKAGEYSDVRTLLCRATGHLALADALAATPSWNNQIADAALHVIAGRQVEAESLLGGLALKPDAPAAARSWIAALNIINRQDATGATVTADSPRLLKIAWFQALMENQPPLRAVQQLEQLGQPDEIVDWTRAIMDAEDLPVEIGNRFCESSVTIEDKELGEILSAEGAPPIDPGHLDATFGEPEPDTVSPDADGHMRIRVVGTGTFKAAARRHLFQDIEKNEIWLSNLLGDAEAAKTFQGQMIELYNGVPFFELVRQHLGDPGVTPMSIDDRLRRENKSWKMSDLPAAQLFGLFGQAPLLNTYFLEGPPIGTAFTRHLPFIINLLKIGPDWHRDARDNDPASDLKQKFMETLVAMRPGSLELVRGLGNFPGANNDPQAEMSRLAPFLKYNIHAYADIERVAVNLDDAQREALWKSRCELDPDMYFEYGDYLWKKGRVDDAAEAYRKAVAQGRDQVRMANSVGNLVNYDWDHGKKDEAMQIAKDAAAVYSQCGLETYLLTLEKAGNLDGAEQQGLAIRDRYGKATDLFGLYARHPDKFAGKGDAMLKTVFPGGVASVTLASFTDAPAAGVTIDGHSGLLTACGLADGDIIVALNGTRVENTMQYDFVRAKMTGSEMDLIAWHGGKYIEVKASPPQHLFGVDFLDFPPATNR